MVREYGTNDGETTSSPAWLLCYRSSFPPAHLSLTPPSQGCLQAGPCFWPHGPWGGQCPQLEITILCMAASWLLPLVPSSSVVQVQLVALEHLLWLLPNSDLCLPALSQVHS